MQDRLPGKPRLPPECGRLGRNKPLKDCAHRNRLRLHSARLLAPETGALRGRSAPNFPASPACRRSAAVSSAMNRSTTAPIETARDSTPQVDLRPRRAHSGAFRPNCPASPACRRSAAVSAAINRSMTALTETACGSTPHGYLRPRRAHSRGVPPPISRQAPRLPPECGRLGRNKPFNDCAHRNRLQLHTARLLAPETGALRGRSAPTARQAPLAAGVRTSRPQ